MARLSNQKLKIIYLMKILLEETDDSHSISMNEIIEKLNGYGVSAERKSISSDMECLEIYGLDIISEQKGHTAYYHIGNRQFELPELKLLVDAVQSAKFITNKKSNELIKKIEGFASKYEASQLQRQVYVLGRAKTMNENIYLNVDVIHSAIAHNSKIKFQYFKWNTKKEMELRKNGDFYSVSPWALAWNNENYYMIAYDSKAGMIKHFRVDKMINISESRYAREGIEHFKKINMATYEKKMFSMFGGEEIEVQLQCNNVLAGAIIDRFGSEISIVPLDESTFTVYVKVAVSMQFIHWIMALGDGAKIIRPDHVVDMVKNEVQRLVKQYQ